MSNLFLRVGRVYNTEAVQQLVIIARLDFRQPIAKISHRGNINPTAISTNLVDAISF
jgi:hypothetical protein